MKQYLLVRHDLVDGAREHYGFFALLSNEVKGSVTALCLYRTRDLVEKAFWNVKKGLNLERTKTLYEVSLQGKRFGEAIVMILLSYIQKEMEEEGLFEFYMLHELFDGLHAIECFVEPGESPI